MDVWLLGRIKLSLSPSILRTPGPGKNTASLEFSAVWRSVNACKELGF